MPLSFSNVWMTEEIQSARLAGLSVPLTADAMLWIGAATVLISELAFFATPRAAPTIATPGVPSWSDGVSWFVREYSG